MNFDDLVGMPTATIKKPLTMIRQEEVDKIASSNYPEKKMIEWFDSHYYKIGEDFFPSVTTILSASPKPYLSFWRGDVGNEEANKIMREAGERGSLIHNLFAGMLNGRKVAYRQGYDQDDVLTINDQFIQLSLWKLVRFMKAVQPNVICSEEIMYSKIHSYAGTMDLLFEVKAGSYNINGVKPIAINGGLYVADIKSGKNIDDEAYWQTAAYAKAYEEIYRVKVNGTMILHTQSMNKGSIEGFGVKVRNEEEMNADFVNFLKIYEVWKIKPYPSKPRFIADLPQVLELNEQLIKKQ
jgi:hypothetical protein